MLRHFLFPGDARPFAVLGRMPLPLRPREAPRPRCGRWRGASVLAQIAYPLRRRRPPATPAAVWSIGDRPVRGSPSRRATPALTRGPAGGAALVAVAGGGGLLAEAVGVATGFPFGRYAYAGTLGPRLLGVPLVVPLAWAWMAWPAWLVGGPAGPRPGRPGRGGRRSALAAWDLFLDPQMVAAGHWHWADAAPRCPACRRAADQLRSAGCWSRCCS